MNAIAALLTAIVGAIIGSQHQSTQKVTYWQTPEGRRHYDRICLEIDAKYGWPPGTSKSYDDK